MDQIQIDEENSSFYRSLNAGSFPPPGIYSWSNTEIFTSQDPKIMEFKGRKPASFPIQHNKRRLDLEPDIIPKKKMMTEERMAAYLNDLHISSDDHSSSSDSLWSMSGEDDSVSSYTVNMSQWDLERKLRNAQKITICDEVLGLNKTVVPEVLLSRHIDRPCTALVLWQPPSDLTKFLDLKKQEESNDNDKEDEITDVDIEEDLEVSEIEMDPV